jgi:predicted DNA-binding transcriptional regulator YafY
MPPLLLADDETVAVALGLRHAASGTISGVEEASVRALAKIEQILPPRLRRRVEALQAIVVHPYVAKSAVDSAVLSTLAGACRDRESVRFRYLDFSGKASSRAVEPCRLVHTGRSWYLVAWDTGRTDWRTFRVDRIQPRVSTGVRFPPRNPPADDLAAYVTRGQLLAPPCRAKLKLLTDAETAAKQLAWYGLIEAASDRTCYFEVRSSSYAMLAVHLGMLEFEFEVVEPPVLVAELRRVIERYRKALGS